MKITPTRLHDVMVVETPPLTDDRGAFSRLFCTNELTDIIGQRRIVQINHSRTHAPGAVRGLHYQRPPRAEMKFVRCIRGRVWDVVVDLRAGSPTFLQWHAEELSAGSSRMLIVPEGCAHGFQVLDPDSEMLYLHTAFYEPSFEGGLHCNDPRVAITWPMPVTELSGADSSRPFISEDFSGLSA